MIKINYSGPARGIPGLVGLLKNEGLDVRHPGSHDQRTSESEMNAVAVILVGGDTIGERADEQLDVIVARVITKFRDRFNGPVRVDVEQSSEDFT